MSIATPVGYDPATEKLYTLDEWRALEDAHDDIRHEFIDGRIYPMAGAHENHTDIVFNLAYELRNLMKASDCHGVGLDQRVGDPTNGYFYPDFVITCGERAYDRSENPAVLRNPTVLFEVLSDSTAVKDLSVKYWKYRQIASLQAFAYIRQDVAHITLHTRDGDDWRASYAEGRDATLTIPALGIDLPLKDVYQGVKLLEAERSSDEPDQPDETKATDDDSA